MTWQHCGQADAPPFFDLTIHGDGKVRYRGTSDVRDKDSHDAQASVANSGRVYRAAMKLVQLHAAQGPEPRGEYCLKLRFAQQPAVLIGVGEPREAVIQEFERELRHAVELARWVCPARNIELNLLAACQRPVISFLYSERENCGDFHVARIYDDGQVHYFTSGSTEGDRYYRIARDRVRELFDEGSKFKADVVYSHGRRDPDHRELIGAGMLIEYKQTLTRLAGVPWQPLLIVGGCSDKQEYPTGSLLLDRW